MIKLLIVYFYKTKLIKIELLKRVIKKWIKLNMNIILIFWKMPKIIWQKYDIKFLKLFIISI